MKRAVFVFIFVVVLAFPLGCFVHFPEIDDMAEGSPSPCLDYQRCLYYSSKAEVNLDCSAIYQSCAKYRLYNECQKERPEGISFQSCWDKLD